MSNDEVSEPAQIYVSCAELESAMKFLIDRLGFRLDMIMPADAPRIALVSGHGIRLRLEQVAAASSRVAAITLRLPSALKNLYSEITDAPDWIVITYDEVSLQTFTLPNVIAPLISRLDGNAQWEAGRAGMTYRDLIPGRLHGEVIASHIRIVDGGPVDDYVHYHKVGMQMIYCRRGWVRVVYEDQGEPFVMQAGDCVLQPPTIRHRVLESSAGLEVIELGSPAEHETWRDHDMRLPTGAIRPERLFEGQRFVRHIAREVPWLDLMDGVRCREIDIDSATRGKAGARTIELGSPNFQSATYCSQTADFRFLFVLNGQIVLDVGDEQPIKLATDDACVLPSKSRYSLHAGTPATLLEISFPAAENARV